MAQNISLSIFGTFGNPNGFTQTIAGEISGIKKYDLNPTAIQVFDSTVAMYALKKEMVGGVPVVSFVKYSYASEQGSSRGGTFIGASVINANGVADADAVTTVLNDLHSDLVSNPANIQDGVIMVKHSSEFTVKNIATNNLKVNPETISDIDFAEKGKSLLVYTTLDNISETFQRALDLLNDYDTIFFTRDQQVAGYVQKKGLYEVIQEVGDVKQFTEKIKSVEEEKSLKQKAVLDKLLKDIEGVKSDKALFIKRTQESINKNKEIHQKNAEKISEAEKNLSQYSSSYDSQASRLRLLSQKLEGKQLKQSERKQIENEIREIYTSFEKEKRGFIEPSRLDAFSEPQRLTPTTKPFVDHYADEDDGHSRRRKSSQGFSTKDIAVILGVVLLLGSLGYAGWYFLGNKKINQEIASTGTEAHIPNETENDGASDSIRININPVPNNILSSNDTKITIDRQLSADKLPMPVDTVVEKIFKANPTDIGKKYEGQEKEYGDFLIQKNPNNFDQKKQLINTARLQIPIYKEGKEGKSDSIWIATPVKSVDISTVDNLMKEKK